MSPSRSYGEGKQAVGGLLEHVLTRSNNAKFLPGLERQAVITATSLPIPPSTTKLFPIIFHSPLRRLIQTSRHCSHPELARLVPDSMATRLYEVDQLSRLSLVAGQTRLSGLVFPLTDPIRVLEPEHDSNSSTPLYHATTLVLGNVLIQTAGDLSRTKRLVLIHPWITPLLDADFSDDSLEFYLATRARRLVFRLRQPFGALLLTSRGREPYRRVATDSFIETQVRQEVTLEELVDSVRTVDIL